MKFRNITIVILINLFMTIGAFAVPPGNDNFADALNLDAITFNNQVHIGSTNVDATKEANEPNHAGNVGGKSVWFKWTAQMSRQMLITTNRSATNLNTLLQIYRGTALNNLIAVTGNNDIDSPSNLKSRLILNAVAGTTYYIALDGHSDSSTPAAQGSYKLDIQPYFPHQSADFDGDGMTDLSVFRPSIGTWLVNGTTRSFSENWGTNGDIPIVAGFSSLLGQTIFRPSDGTWYIRPYCCSDRYIQFGTSGDIPVTEDFGGSISNVAVFRPSNGIWYLYFSATDIRYYQFGQQGDIPVAGNYSPDNFADVAVFRPSNGTWYFTIRVGGNPNQDTFRAIQFGQEGDKPVPGDYDGDGLLDVAIYRPSTGTWWVLQSSNNRATAFQWGIAEDIPTTGDYNGDGKFDYAVFRPSTGTWYINQSGDNQVQVRQFGQTGDIPMTANRAY